MSDTNYFKVDAPLGIKYVNTDYNALATIAVADSASGVATVLMTVDLTRMDGSAMTTAKQVYVRACLTGYTDDIVVSTTVTFGTATAGSIIASGSGWMLCKTSVAGAFACTATNSADETLLFGCSVPPAGVSIIADGLVGCISNSDSAQWIA